MNDSKWRIPLLAAACAFATILYSCGKPVTDNRTQNTSTPTATQPGVLVYGSGGQPVNLEPGNITDGNSIVVHYQIYDRLLEAKPGSSELQPDLATSWSVSGDGKVWTFKLRSGVKFHDGTDFNAAAVKFNVERWWDAKHPNGYRNAGKSYEIWQQLFGGFKGEPNSLLQDIAVVDNSTIQFKLKQPFAVFPAAIGSGYFGIASPTAVKKAGASYGTPSGLAVGTGPFIFKEWRTGDRIILQKNPNYWQKGFPKVNQVVIRFIGDPAARLAQLRAGQIDFTVDLAPDQSKEIAKDANLVAVPRPSFNVGYLALNPSYKPLADVRVRQAIASAINKAQIVPAFWGNLGTSDPHFTAPSLKWAQSTKITDYKFNPQAAKQLLAQAGYPNGFDLELWYMPVSRPYFPTPKPIGEAFAADLNAIGIRVKLNTKDWAAYLEDRRKAPGFQAFMLGWTADYSDPDSFYYPHFGPGATTDLGNWNNDRVVQLLNKARATVDRTARGKIYAEVDEILHQEAVRLPIVHSQPLLARRKNIQGWVPSPLGSESFETITKN
ncbi:ABC transporter substrate-binding protein [Planktothrix sp. FACHB-1355]|uniref:ABC transporter substrate-binding protein n=1 Tax=Aerosakkonema funiforme FACHB-1375 TaxID=2949571 RepID=A0A926VCP3_9CYAN|nr:MULTISPECIES: ABC transporter substrate-binding protein [Oscillatoriales]MBD2181363.1 ABC transporter substrate-binding protein [Aerosakkonema funiforme FACHB-1375]MBD3557737.1 ABC transporter substrate-binding protein [Planktothrix sp. FACHB-1355]